MGPVTFVEVLDGHGSVAQRYRFDELPVDIGRGYHNGVILDDPFVSPAHARLLMSPDGELLLEDLGSVNGTYGFRDRVRRATIPIRPGTRVRLGRTVLRFATPDQPVAETSVEAAGWTRALAQADRPSVTLLVLGLALLFLVVPDALSTTEADRTNEIVAIVLGLFVLVGMWAGAWAVATRIALRRFRFFRHLAVTCLTVVAMTVTVTLFEYREFIFSPSKVAANLEFFIEAVILGLLFYAHLTIMERFSSVRRGIVAAVVAITITIATVELGRLAEEEFSSEVIVTTSLKPLSTSWVSTTTLDDFLDDAGSLREELDAEADEPDSPIPIESLLDEEADRPQ